MGGESDENERVEYGRFKPKSKLATAPYFEILDFDRE